MFNAALCRKAPIKGVDSGINVAVMAAKAITLGATTISWSRSPFV